MCKSYKQTFERAAFRGEQGKEKGLVPRKGIEKNQLNEHGTKKVSRPSGLNSAPEYQQDRLRIQLASVVNVTLVAICILIIKLIL